MNRPHSRITWIAGMVLVALLALPATAVADDNAPKGYWLVSVSAPASSEVLWGRLVVKDGMLKLFAPRTEWQTPLSDVKRVARVKGESSFEIETVTGDRLRLAILGPQLLTESPKKAMQVIQRAVRETPRPVVSTSTTFGRPR